MLQVRKESIFETLCSSHFIQAKTRSGNFAFEETLVYEHFVEFERDTWELEDTLARPTVYV